MATPRLLSLPFYANLQKMYVCAAPIGSDLNAGYSELYPKETILAAYDALPAHGGIIYIMGACRAGGEVQGQGLWIGDGGNQLFPGWRASKPVTFIGYAAGNINGLFSMAQAAVLPGRVGDVSKPSARYNVGCWLAGTAHSLYFQGIIFQGFDVPGRMAVSGNPALDPDAPAQRGSAQTTANARFDLCTFQTPDDSGGRDQGPCMDMGYFLFLWFNQCSFNQANLDNADYLSDRRAGILVNPGDGSSQLYVNNCYGANGGIKYYNGPSNWSVNINSYLIEASGNPLPPVVKLIGCNAFGSGYINNLVGADSSNTPALVDNSLASAMPPGNLVVLLGSGSGGEVLGPATVLGGFSAGFPATTAMPSAKGQIALMGYKIAGDTDVVRFNNPVATNRCYNMVPQRDGSQGLVGNVVNPPALPHSANRVWTQAGATGSGTVNSPISDRRGTTTAIRLSTNDVNDASQDLFNVGQTCAVGDVWVAGAWFRSTVALVETPLSFGIAAGAGAPTFSAAPALQQPWGTDGQWMFVAGYIKCLTAGGGATATPRLVVTVTTGVAIDIDPSYFMLKIAAGTMSANELGNLMQSLVSFVQAPVGSATTQPGQMLIAQGGLGTANYLAAVDHTLGATAKLMPVYDNFANLLGYCELKPLTS